MHRAQLRQLGGVLLFERALSLRREILQRPRELLGFVDEILEAIGRDDRPSLALSTSARVIPPRHAHQQTRVDLRREQIRLACRTRDVHAMTNLEQPVRHAVPVSEQIFVRRHAEDRARREQIRGIIRHSSTGLFRRNLRIQWRLAPNCPSLMAGDGIELLSAIDGRSVVLGEGIAPPIVTGRPESPDVSPCSGWWAACC